MRDIDRIRREINNKKEVKESKFEGFFTKLFLLTIIFFLCYLITKKDERIKEKIYNKVYNSNINFATIKSYYNKYLGNVLPFEDNIKDKNVFNEKLTYNSLSNYNKGVKLSVKDNYLIPAINGGIVIFDGIKDNMNTIIIQQSDGIDAIYQNFSNKNVKLYDYVKKNAILGEVKNNTLYLTFKKDGVEIDYKEVIK